MVSKDNVAGLIAILSGMLVFKATAEIPFVENLIQQWPLVVVGLAVALFVGRRKIADKIGG